MDTNRELRSMIFCAIHLPPLPAVVSRLDNEDNTVLDSEACESSHSIIGSMMEWTAMANNEQSNAKRLVLQKELLHTFKTELAGMDLDTCKAEELYDLYCRHTRQWLNTYSTVGNMLRIKPLDYMVNNDKTHQNMQGYTKAQHRLYMTGQPFTLPPGTPYAGLMRECAKWTKLAMTDTGKDEEKKDTLDNNNSIEAILSNVFNNTTSTVDENSSSENDLCAWVGNDSNGVDLVRSRGQVETVEG
jgi:hypothetical protein